MPGNLTCLSSQTVVSCLASSLPWDSEHIWFSRTATVRNGHQKVLLHLLKGNALPAPISFPVSSLLSVWQQQGSTGSQDDTDFWLQLQVQALAVHKYLEPDLSRLKRKDCDSQMRPLWCSGNTVFLSLKDAASKAQTEQSYVLLCSWTCCGVFCWLSDDSFWGI